MGVDTINACYGGTNALFNAVNGSNHRCGMENMPSFLQATLQSTRKGQHGRLVVLRWLGLVGPDAPLILESDTVVSYFEHAYDFYKPNMSSEYPTVDGPLSNDATCEPSNIATKTSVEKLVLSLTMLSCTHRAKLVSVSSSRARNTRKKTERQRDRLRRKGKKDLA